ncbi:MAG: aspartyl protease family protein, partial [Phycisphaerae bacterium]
MGVSILARFDSGVPLLEVMINRKGPFRFLVDTGLRRTFIDDDVAKRLSLPSAGTIDVNERRLLARGNVATVKIGSLALGDALFSDLDVPVIDFAAELGAYRKIDGVLGLATFADCLLAMDYIRGRVAVGPQQVPQADGREILDYRLRDGLATIPLTVGGRTVDAIIETGLPGALRLANSFKEKVDLAEKPLGRIGARLLCDVDPDVDVLKETVRFGAHELVQCMVEYQPGTVSIGHEVLKHFVVSLDQKNRRARFTHYGSGPVRILPRSRYGLTLTRGAGVFKVVRVDPGSPADDRGLAAGDEIRLFEKRRPSQIRDAEIVAKLREADSLFLTLKRGR